ncbi:response regulator [Roseivirga echinicomitans]|uniref:Response regulatory domain-containing protein n=1 Tax=Roseivirga echinicomitans TaxID=296218 RepID=A0A150X9I3_9BACT|nr:response regulator [Roseivirga echinicomitans]KYG75363.1 hypothetical protein AWN68_07380 [Roseivirga echinicomitans]
MIVRKRILILDDEPSTRLLLRHYFSKGYNLTIHENGLKELNRLEKSKHADLTITNLKTPKMDGFDFIDEICSKDRFRGAQIIVTSGLAEIEVRKRIDRNCANVQKLGQISTLKERV